ncbi:hypothetical protein FPZ08_10250 [Devosia ginsengisoli]|uniref:Uncharacterized protein n=1 Tax=Devosia ginsengisoli TaxID=400770 RepID=A0A5B8LUS2_9HYPH|nr:hypothetical protein FPZ08_10250 [Devosia ginsengisoli]
MTATRSVVVGVLIVVSPWAMDGVATARAATKERVVSNCLNMIGSSFVTK